MDMLGVTFIAVSKVIVAVLIGVFTTTSIPHSAATLRDFGYLISTLLITCLTISNTAKSVNLEVLIRCSVLILFSIIMIACGLLCGVSLSIALFRMNPKYSGIPEELRKDVRLDLLYDRVEADDEAPVSPASPSAQGGGRRKKKAKKIRVPYVAVVLSEHFREVCVAGGEIVNALEVPDPQLEDYAGYSFATWVGCSTQNGVTLPLSLMTNIATSVPFLDMNQGAAYIFVFTISYMLYLWSACPAFVEAGQKAAATQRLIRETLIKHRRMMTRCDATTQTLSLSLDRVPGYANEEADAGDAGGGSSSSSRRRSSPAGDGAAAPVASAAGRQVSWADSEGNPLVDSRQPSHVVAPVASSTSSDSSPSDSSTGTQEGHNVGDDEREVRGRSGDAAHHARSRNPGALLQSSFAQTEGDETLESGFVQTRCSSGVSFRVPGAPTLMTPTSAADYAFTMATSEQLPYDWAAAGFIRVKYESEVWALKHKTLSQRLGELRHASWSLLQKLMTSPPFLSVVIGMFIGVVPRVRSLFFGGPLDMVMDAVALIGQGSIPASLLLLGANLVGSSAGTGAAAAGGAPGQVRLRHAEQNTELPLHQADWRLLGENGAYAAWYDEQHEDVACDLHESFSLQTLMRRGQLPASMRSGAAAVAPMAEYEDELGEDAKKSKGGFMDGVQTALSLRGIRHTFVWGIISFRLVVAPAFSFCLLVFLINTMPFLFGGAGTLDKTLIMVLMVELAAPTAINSTLLFNARQFMTYPWSKMLFFQYLLCTVTMVMWAAIGLSYTSRLP